jgi:hypothetical protein
MAGACGRWVSQYSFYAPSLAGSPKQPTPYRSSCRWWRYPQYGYSFEATQKALRLLSKTTRSAMAWSGTLLRMPWIAIVATHSTNLRKVIRAVMTPFATAVLVLQTGLSIFAILIGVAIALRIVGKILVGIFGHLPDAQWLITVSLVGALVYPAMQNVVAAGLTGLFAGGVFEVGRMVIGKRAA